MRPIRSILVPTDFSASSTEAMLYAFDLARSLGARVTLLHVYQLRAYALPDGSALIATPRETTSIVQHVDSALHDLKLRADAHAGVAVATQSAQGAPADEILRAASDGDYDLIIMGTHGRTGLKHLFLGSVAEAVVRRSERPVLTVRASDAARAQPWVSPPIL